MQRSRTRTLLFRIAMLIYIAAVAYLCLANFKSLPKVSREFFGIPTDKIVHFCMFFPFPILGFYAYDKYTETPWQALAAIVSVCAFGGIFAGLTELIQGTLSYRSQDIRDFGADCLAIGISALLVFCYDVYKMKKKR